MCFFFILSLYYPIVIKSTNSLQKKIIHLKSIICFFCVFQVNRLFEMTSKTDKNRTQNATNDNCKQKDLWVSQHVSNLAFPYLYIFPGLADVSNT